MVYHYLYKIVNLTNDKFYVGMRSCKCDPHEDKYMGSSEAIHKDVKLNPEKYKKEILFFASDRNMLEFYESVFVTKEEVENPLCYNMKAGGLGGWGPRSKEQIRKNAEACKGKPLSEETKRKLSESMKGRIRSAKTQQKMNDSRQGYRHSEETKKKISDTFKRKERKI